MSRSGALVFTYWNIGVNQLSESKCCTNKDRLHLLRLMVLLHRLTECFWRESTHSLMGYLHEQNLEISVRQLQRELNFLQRHFRIAQRGGRQGVARWCWTGDRVGYFEEEFTEPGKAANLPLDGSLRDPDKTRFPDSSMLKLLRVLTLVELIPIEESGAWVSIDELCQGLQGRGLGASMRTVQRDIHFIKRHFLIVLRQRAGGKQELQRLEFREWQTSFCPRAPGNQDSESLESQRTVSILLDYPCAMASA